MIVTARTIRSVIGTATLLCGLLAGSRAPAAIDAMEASRCTVAGGQIEVLGLPEHYRSVDMASEGCLVESYGSDYQILDWFENGKLDAAVLSPFAVTLMKERDLGETDLEETRAVPGGGGAEPDSSAGWRRFLEELIVETDGSAYGVRLHRHGYSLRYYRNGRPQGDARQALKSYLQQPEEARLAAIYLPSHLSSGLPILIREMSMSLGIPVAAEDKSKAASSQWKRLIASLRFTVADEPPSMDPAEEYFLIDEMEGSCGSEPDCLIPGVEQDLIVRSRAGSPLPSSAEIEGHERRFATWNEYLCPSCTERLATPLREFQVDNYTRHVTGSRRQRHYRFTIDELWTILRGQKDSDDDLALVLTGGGVKAAYQTQLIEDLYSKGYLYNIRAEGARPEHPATADALSVDYVIGTSGGALLGVFVSALSGSPGQLVERLWGGPGEEMNSTDVFPFVEMLRYGSVLVSVLLFALLCAAALRRPALKRQLLPAEPTPAEERSGQRYWRLVIPWTVMLFVAPWLIKHVNGEAGLEHVPGVAGLFYSAYIAMAVYSDNVLRFRGDAEPYGRLSYAWALLLVGIAIALAPLPFDPAGDFRNQFHHVRGLGGFTQATLTTCIGLLVVALSVSRFAAYRAQRGRGGRLLCGTLVLLTAPLLTYVLLFATGKPLFELTGEFWLWLCLYSLLVGVVVLFIARPLSGKVRRGFDFLFEEHPAETFTLRLKRYSRALLFFASAWLWWNFVNAPALYGNETAKRHFATIVQGDTDGECRIEFQTAFVIAATSLDTAREVYFYAYPAKVAGDAADTAELNVRNDPRWVEFGPAVRHDDLVSIVFASGSPFPVFPMTRVSAPPLAPSCEEAGSARNYDPDRRENEWLVDGGYAHNIPIDAARQLGAERVLVVSSSPLHTDEDRGGVTTFSIGRLIIGLPRLFPYLFERSQIEDVLSTEGMLVAAISPPPTVEDWPALTDFRPARIRKVVEEARKNITMRERIGTVESWGQPLCRLGDIDVPCEALRTLGGRKTGVERRAVR